MLDIPNVMLFFADVPDVYDERHNEMKFHSYFTIEKPNSYEEYNKLIVKNFHKYFSTNFILITQHDGYILNPNAWQSDFLEYDYIGAPWSDGVVGNGGFSLRSKKFCELSSEIESDIYAPEDVLLCRTHRKFFEDNGIKFAPEELAHKFSWEKNSRYPYYEGQFGFHGEKP